MPAHHRKRRILMESLESRRLLASDFQNPRDSFDVNDDHSTTLLDVLTVINYLSRSGSHLPDLGPGETPERYWDANGDDRVTAGDALQILNHCQRSDHGQDHDPGGSGVIFVSADKHGQAGGIQFEREDIIAFDTDSQSWSMEFDGSNVGLSGADVNAFHFLSDHEILMAIDRSGRAELPGFGSVHVDPSDILKFTATSLGSQGELHVTASDPEGNETRLQYEEPSRPHFLTEIIDPLGRSGLRSEYDDSGRLIHMIDAGGQVVELIHDPNNFVETVKDQLGNPTTYEYDSDLATC